MSPSVTPGVQAVQPQNLENGQSQANHETSDSSELLGHILHVLSSVIIVKICLFIITQISDVKQGLF